MTRIRRAVDAATEQLATAGIGSARVDAELLAAHVVGVERGRLFVAEPDDGFESRLSDVVDARARRVPLQHIVGSAPFGPLMLSVGPGVFVPRPETESLLEWAMAQRLPASSLIVDLCTGSGALAIALAHAAPSATVIAVENSPTALNYARRNAADAGAVVEIVSADVTTGELLASHDGAVDLLVANPPYIPDGAVLDPEVADHDPAEALFGGADGMSVIRPIVGHAVRLLRRGSGRIAIEHDDTTAAETIEEFERTGAFRDVTSCRDLAGRPRFVTAVRAE